MHFVLEVTTSNTRHRRRARMPAYYHNMANDRNRLIWYAEADEYLAESL